MEMERLTSDGLTACAMCVGEELGCRPVVASGRYAHEKWEKMQNCHNRKVYDRLREYEKTGLTPEQITYLRDTQHTHYCANCEAMARKLAEAEGRGPVVGEESR